MSPDSELEKMAISFKAALLGALALGVVCARHGMGQADSSFAALQERGKMAMGVDQYTSAHRFDVLPSGGRIALETKQNDSLAIAQIRAHMRLIQHAFQAGDFSTPAFVHMRAMPGTDVMSRRRALIDYTYGDLPRGGEVRIASSDPESLVAIRRFLAAQGVDHHADGHGHRDN
jgi:hypothetical protein